MEIKEEGERRKKSEETRAHLEAMVLRTKREANNWQQLTPRIAALGSDAFERGPVMIKKIHAYLVKEVNLAKNAEKKIAEFVNRVCQITLEAFWTQNVKGDAGQHAGRVGSRMYRVPSGKSLRLALSIPDQRVPPSKHRVIICGNTSPVCDVWSGELCERTSCTAH